MLSCESHWGTKMHVFAALQPQASEAEPHSHLHHELDTKPVGDDLTSVHRSFLEVRV